MGLSLAFSLHGLDLGNPAALAKQFRFKSGVFVEEMRFMI
jgi:hypothetical protein